MFPSTDANPLIHPQFPAASTTFHGGSHPQLQDHYLFPHHLFPNSTHMLFSANNNNVNSKPLNSYVFPSCRRRTKKDRHTKILTAQGPRDRRVRLSTCIARKFFDLQDTLGFDKPSKTLNWLFAQSKLAIEELFHANTKMAVEDAHYKKKFELQQTVSGEDSQEMGKRAKDSPTIGVFTDLAKHSRAKARERARARTIKKMCFKELSEAKMLLGAAEPSPLHKNNELATKQVATKESITPRICSVWDIPKHLMMPKDLGVGHSNGGYSHNVSSSQVLQICRKSWGCSDHNYQN